MAPKARLRPPYAPKNIAAHTQPSVGPGWPGGAYFHRLARPRPPEAQVWSCRRPDIAAISGGTGRTSGDAGVVLLQKSGKDRARKGEDDDEVLRNRCCFVARRRRRICHCRASRGRAPHAVGLGCQHAAAGRAAAAGSGCRPGRAGQHQAALVAGIQIPVHPRTGGQPPRTGRLVPRGPSGDARHRRPWQGHRAAPNLCLRIVPLSQRQGPPGERQRHRTFLRVHRPAADGLQERPQEDLGSEKAQHRLDGRIREGR